MRHIQLASSAASPNWRVSQLLILIFANWFLQLVPKSSAIVPGMVNAEANILYKDHVGMAKFEHAGDGDLQTLSLHLSWMVQTAPPKVEERWERYKRHEGV
jgi:hypothetical protein